MAGTARALSSLLIVMLPMAGGCVTTTQYQPVRSEHIVRVSNGYVRDGIKYREGFGGGLVEAVHGCPEAEGLARSARAHAIAGFAVGATGFVMEAGGLVLLIAGTTPADGTHPGHVSTAGDIGALMALTGVAAVIVGEVVEQQAPPKGLDAVNMCNDQIDARRGAER